MKKILLTIIGFAAIIGVGVYWNINHSPEAKLISVLKNSLNDPYSAKIGEHYYFKKSGGLCGIVNAKNKYGAYVGDTRFVVEKSGQVTFQPQETTTEFDTPQQKIDELKTTLVFLELFKATCLDETNN